MANIDADPARLLARLGALNDLARLRMLRLLHAEELSVGELARALQLPQSTVSRHLKLLHDAQWVEKRTVGTASFYRLDDEALSDEARALWDAAQRMLGPDSAFDEDDARLHGVLAERAHDSKTYFGRIGGEWDEIRNTLFGRGFTAEALLSFLQRDWILADLGCGTGNAAEHVAPFVKRVIAIDREPAMIEAAGKRLAAFDNIEFRQGELSRLPLKDREINAAMIFLVMHHIDDPAAVVCEAARALKPAGLLMIVDMVAHDREDYRRDMGHKHLGFSERDVRSWAKRCGLSDITWRRLRPDSESKGPGLFVATMRKT
jgi:ArsR family transcriptional regulator